eukprot:6138486-Prymnesium_polylepis.1
MAEGQQLLVDGAPSEPFLHAAAMGYYEAIFSMCARALIIPNKAMGDYEAIFFMCTRPIRGL